MKQTLTTIIILSLTGTVLGLILFQIGTTAVFGYSFMMISLILGQIAGICLFLMESRIFRTLYFRLILIGISLFIIGTLFRIQHWVGTSVIILISFLIISVTYIFRFIAKKPKSIVDFIKVIWITLALLSYYFRLRHWYFADLLMYISISTFWVGLLIWLYNDYKSKRIEELSN